MNRTTRFLLIALAVTLVAAGCRRRTEHKWRETVKTVQVPAPQPPPGPDTTPPAVTANLSITGMTSSTARLTWTATGDDGYEGTAGSFDVRYSTSVMVTEADFDAATPADGEPVPGLSGTPQTMLVTGLSPSTTYWFALRTIDMDGNASPMSNVEQGTTLPPPDVTPPAAVVDLRVLWSTSNSMALEWTAPGDDGSTGTATRYDLRCSTSPIVTDADFDAAVQVTGEPVPAPAGETDDMVVTGLLPGTAYWFALKSHDEVPNVSGLSNVATGVTQILDVTPPAAIADLAVIATTFNSLTLAWTAPGDDGATGTAAAYDIRMSPSPITTDAEFDAAIPVAAWYLPSPAGSAEALVLNGLWASTTYCFAIKSRDEVPNVSALSNSAAGTTDPPPDVTPPAAVGDLAVVAWTDQSLTLTWTAPGDDGSTGQAAWYDLRMSNAPITSDAEFLAAAQVPGLPAPQIAGSPEMFVVGGLPAGVLRYFAIKTADDVPNISALSNLASGTTSTLPVLLVVDEVEPNDALGNATPLPPGRPGRGHLDTLDDVDLWSFSQSAGDVITIELFSTRLTQTGWSAVDSIPILKILDNGGNELLRHDRGAWLDGSHDLDVPLFRIPADGTYFVRLQASEGNSIREYAVLVRDVPMSLVPEAEPPGTTGGNNTFGSAEFVAGPATVYGWHVDGESDYFKFQVRAGDIIRLAIVAYRNGVVQGPGYFNPRLWIYDPFGHKVEKVSSTVFHDVEISYFAPIPGMYAVRVLEDAGSSGEGPYFLSISSAPAPDTVESEPNNSPATADPIVYGGFVMGWSSLFGSDWYSFQGTAGDMVRVEVFDVVNSYATWRQANVEIVGPDGVTLVPGNDPEGAFNTFRCILSGSGTHYVRVPPGGLIPAFYGFRLLLFKEAPWESEPNDDFAAPGALDAAGRAAGVIGTGGDADAFGFTATATELVTISAYAGRALVPPGSDGDHQRSGWGSDLSPMLIVRDSGGNVLAISQNGLAFVSAESVTNPLPTLEVTFVAPASGSYTVTVESSTGGGGPAKTYVLQRR